MVGNGINDFGQVVGSYETASGNQGRAFLHGGSFYLTLTDPNADPNADTVAFGINDAGQIVGYYIDANNIQHAFVDNGGTFTNFDAPSATLTTARSINSNGVIVGDFQDAFDAFHGFIDDHGNFTILNDPLATNGTFAYGVNDAGQVVGSYFDAIGGHGFLYSGGTYTTIDEPNAIAGQTRVYGINDAGRIVGTYSGNPFFAHGFETVPIATEPDDFNGDGISDLLWRSAAGALAGWQINGSAISSSASVTYQGSTITPDASWSIAASSDFDGDGRSDLLWRQSTGALAIWLMNGSAVSASSSLTYQGSALAPDASWTVAGSGDFNGDGKADILWRQSTGALALWDMNGTTISASGVVTFQGSALAPDASWTIAGVADFNGDGMADILWRQNSGALALWNMNGSAITSSTTVTAQGKAVAPDASWSVAGVGDFNGDGNSDLLWRQSSTGSLAVWLMNGSNVVSSGLVTYQGKQVAPDASWSIVEVGDFNGDGNSDLLWRQGSSGALAEWLMSGNQITSTAPPASQGNSISPDASWSVQAKPTDFA
jgi:probable HAF family extracellular repeat protein